MFTSRATILFSISLLCGCPAILVRALRVDSNTYSDDSLHSQLHSDGYVLFPGQFPWDWQLTRYVERSYAEHRADVESFFEKHRDLWDPRLSSDWDTGASEVAKMASAHFKAKGLKIWKSNLPSESRSPPFGMSGPRWYISTHLGFKKDHGESIEALPTSLRRILWPKEAGGYVRNFGWVMSPPGSDPQTLHEDYPEKADLAHILWKPSKDKLTTEFVRGRLDEPRDEDYKKCQHVNASVAVFLSRVVHRGAATPENGGWGSSCSIEMASPLGQRIWLQQEQVSRDPDWAHPFRIQVQ